MNLSDTTTKQHIVLYFQVHQPRRLRPFRFFDIGTCGEYFDDKQNKAIAERVARQSYLPTNALLLQLIRKYPKIKVVFSVSGVAIDQFKEYTPEVLDSFRALADTGCVEFLSETDHHSLACMMPGDEFELQILDHTAKLHEHFNVRPTVFRNTELIYSDEIGRRVEALGFNGIFTDGIERILHGRSPHHLYQHSDLGGLKIFLRNYHLSDDIAFRFSHHGLTVEKYMAWLNGIPHHENVVTLAMDYETFGEHQKANTGIVKFLEGLLTAIAKQKRFVMATASEVIRTVKPHDTLSVPHYISWADQERDLSAWLGNDMQRDAFDCMVRMERDIKSIDDPDLLERWRWLQTSDHFYYMSTKKNDDGNVHAYFSPYPSPYEAFMNYMNVLNDFSYQVSEHERHPLNKQKAGAIRSEAERRELQVPTWAMNLQNSYEH
ncbi:glycoside hydrolase family 57 protein [Ohtaekwangia kribbensis]|jgi:alpha-amylase|uniref:Glycoside hydrolase family 57 protein n=1 Tax=Ohtaekwangia kribbensis TaxID=688913 RepID=A0ABW3JYE6_9BACT